MNSQSLSCGQKLVLNASIRAFWFTKNQYRIIPEKKNNEENKAKNVNSFIE